MLGTAIGMSRFAKVAPQKVVMQSPWNSSWIAKRYVNIPKTETQRVTLLTGDGVGPEVSDSVVGIFQAAGISSIKGNSKFPSLFHSIISSEYS
jgi:hypothetical protein